jgi:hypothetical protein
MRSIRNSAPKNVIGDQVGPNWSLTNAAATARNRAPMIAPLRLPRPPRTISESRMAIHRQWLFGKKGKRKLIREPDAPARAIPIPKERVEIPRTLTPTIWAAVRFCMVARTAYPVLVR